MVIFSCLFFSLDSPSVVFADTINSSHTYYVSPSGDDDGDGTLKSPWKTIQKAADSLEAGETVFVREGVYEEFITINRSGSAEEGYITFKAYPGETPIVDGENLTISSGKSALFRLRSAHYIKIEGFEIRGLSSSSSSKYPSGIKIDDGGSHIQILENDIHHIGNYSEDGNAHGILIYGNSSDPLKEITVRGNRVHDLILGSSESLTVSGNVDGFTIEDNLVYDNNNIGIDIAGFYGTCQGSCQDQPRNGVVAGNTVYNIDSSTNPAYGAGSRSAGGIYIDGGTDIIIERNQVYSSNFGIELASENKGKATSDIIVRNNYIHHNEGAGLIMGGSGSSNGSAVNNVILNNTFLENDTLFQGYGEIVFQNYVSNNVIVNNLLYAYPDNPFIQKWKTNGTGNLIDYNLYFRISGADRVNWRWEGTSYSYWDEYKLASGNDRHSFFADPMLNQAANNTLSISDDSPLIDRGTLLFNQYSSVDYGGEVRLVGGSVDIGAVEFQGIAQTSFISIDGNAMEWEGIEELESSDSKVRSMKAHLTNTHLYVLIAGEDLHEKGQLFINTGAGLGFEAPYWTNSKAQYLIENGTLYHYVGEGGTDWAWTEVRSYKIEGLFAFSSTMIEMAIPLHDIEAYNRSLSIGYVWNDSFFDRLPFKDEMPQIKQDIEVASELPPAIESTSINVDGDHSDWKNINTIVGGTNLSYKIAHDLNQVYMLVQGEDLTGKIQLYFNIDHDEATGYASSVWSTAGIDLLVENGRIYRYTGEGPNWSWEKVGNLNDSERYVVDVDAVELAIPFSFLDLERGSSFTLGFLLDDNKSFKLPTDGEMDQYTIP